MPNTAPLPVIGQSADPCVMVIFGASGDLTKRKLIPALFNLARENLLSKQFAVIGVPRSGNVREFRQRLMEEIRQFTTGPVDPALFEWFEQRLYVVAGEFEDPDLYQR